MTNRTMPCAIYDLTVNGESNTLRHFGHTTNSMKTKYNDKSILNNDIMKKMTTNYLAAYRTIFKRLYTYRQRTYNCML